MRRMVFALMACVVLVVVSGCAYIPMGALEKSYKMQSEKIAQPTEVEFSNWNILGLIGGSKIRVEAEQGGGAD